MADGEVATGPTHQQFDLLEKTLIDQEITDPEGCDFWDNVVRLQKLVDNGNAAVYGSSIIMLSQEEKGKEGLFLDRVVYADSMHASIIGKETVVKGAVAESLVGDGNTIQGKVTKSTIGDENKIEASGGVYNSAMGNSNTVSGTLSDSDIGSRNIVVVNAVVDRTTASDDNEISGILRTKDDTFNSIGSRNKIATGAKLQNVKIGDGNTIGERAKLTSSTLGDDNTIPIGSEVSDSSLESNNAGIEEDPTGYGIIIRIFNSAVGSNGNFQPGSIITRSTLGDYVKVGRKARVYDSRLPDGSTLGNNTEIVGYPFERKIVLDDDEKWIFDTRVQ